MQIILVSASYAIWAGMLGYTGLLWKKEQTPFYFILVLAVAVGGFAEPLYDESLMLYFYSPGIWSLFTSFDIPQPIWVYSGYVTLYASVAVPLIRAIPHGVSRLDLFKWAGVELLTSCVFEMVGINGGAYEYWGPHVFRVFNYPLCIGILEAAQVMCFSVAAAHLKARAVGVKPLFGLFVLFPATFYLANLGAGAPLIITLHAKNTTPALVTFGSLVTIAFALTLVWGASYLLPVDGQIALGEDEAPYKPNGTVRVEDVENGGS
ncbi:uncharacterized protein BDZ99DRAFT_466633 [Mytilinidion resinicola]|uniref:Uncharacterized protein n=1 Tax=Mytilinidion resinicola TaxID=574789 RepID=A0A6A6YAG4_9PEZI|nr:uncharacterized protein BDZ99DRAFT_466633 [Mytilinidion resinicola]KAF2805690.1 hypothetical protein BDZ99DRAFT_466633 [Mytilinidion resinicola]